MARTVFQQQRDLVKVLQPATDDGEAVTTLVRLSPYDKAYYPVEEATHA